MSRYFSYKYQKLMPYAPGEQPQDMKYVKLNTNESPFPPPPAVLEEVARAAGDLQLYPDPECKELTELLASVYRVEPEEVLLTNGSDEALSFAFMAFCDDERPAAFPDITYGFYPVLATLNGVPYQEIRLADDLSVDIRDYMAGRETIFIANPNAPTGIVLPTSAIEELLAADPDRVVVVDEAYVDFGAESCVPLIHKYDNLLVTQTFSKSRSLAGARLGFAVGCRELINDLNTIKYSVNPYNISRMTMAAGIGSLRSEEYTRANCRTIMENRAYTAAELRKRGFKLTDSQANFVFARHPNIDGQEIYEKLKKDGVLVRYFRRRVCSEYVRVTIGTKEQMDVFLQSIDRILEER
ncbi:MAG: histidinol-phosphate transaminase [Firmicutes bacterium]|nr:histidinol-phosphate transaminase [Bacillota bacterium]